MGCKIIVAQAPFFASVMFAVAVAVAVPTVAQQPGGRASHQDASEWFFANTVLQVRIEIPKDGMAALRRDSRAYVRATVREGTNVWRDAGVRLKGSTGSFRPLDDKPGFTLSFDEFTPGRRFHGLRKMHLNNSVEDASYLNEKAGAELFNAAGVPAPRVGHALVELNGRRLGLYVLKEGFAEEFLARHFQRTDGNLYDAGAGGDITDSLKRSSGAGPADRSDLRRLAAAAQEPDLARRWARLGEVLDCERFVSFLAMEVLCGHRDGYGIQRNNFRLYHDPATGRFVFLPTGMDQLFGRAELPLLPHFSGIVAKAVMETPEGKRAYRERIGLLFTNTLQAGALTNRVRGWAEKVAASLPRGEARALRREAADFSGRIAKRTAAVARLLAEPEPEPEPLRFTNGIARPHGWRAVDVPAGGKLDQAASPDGRAALHIVAGPVTAASWRAKALLEPGKYHFEGRVRAAGVKPLAFGRNHGTALDVAGGQSARPRYVVEAAAWTKLETEFEVRDRAREVELLCALRAGAGEAWFDLESLRLVRLEGEAR